MSTDTTTPNISPELQKRVAQNAAKLKLKPLVDRAGELASGWSEAKRKLAGVVLLSSLGIEEDVPIGQAIPTAVEKAEAHGYTLDLIATKLTEILDKASQDKWGDLAEMLPDSAATKPKAAAKPAKKAGSSTAPRFNVELPKIEVPPAPTVVQDVTDPMGVMAAQIGSRLLPFMEHTAQAQSAALMGKLYPVFEEIIRQAQSQSVVTSGVDEAAVEAKVKKMLNNGAGDEIKKLVSAGVPTTLSDVLEKAARAIAAAGPNEQEQAILKAAFEPIPDPNYAWTEDLVACADMLNQARAFEPQNALLVGPTGCGKSEWAVQFAAKHGLKVMVMDCANIREARDWFGQKGAANGCTFFRKSQFWLAVEAGNCVVLLDEFNRAPDHVRNPLMPLLDHRRQSFVEEVGETLKVGQGTVFLATMNEGLDYSGTHTTDRAMENRFPRRIELTYLPEDKEIQVLCDKVDKLRKLDARKLVELANVVRAKSAGFGGTLTKTISTRQLIAAARDFVLMGPRSFQYTVFAHFSAEGGTESERAQVIQAFEGKGFTLTAPASK